MHRTRIKWAYYCTFRSPIAPDLGVTVLRPDTPAGKAVRAPSSSAALRPPQAKASAPGVRQHWRTDSQSPPSLPYAFPTGLDESFQTYPQSCGAARLWIRLKGFIQACWECI